ncbi:hypothetical protein GCM10020258_43810 [Sphingomonas yabuuchiae]
MVELLAGPLIGDMTSRESIEWDGGRGGSPLGGELIIAIDPKGFLGDLLPENQDRAEAMFAAITGQGHGCPPPAAIPRVRCRWSRGRDFGRSSPRRDGAEGLSKGL